MPRGQKMTTVKGGTGMLSDPQFEISESMRQQSSWVSEVPGQIYPRSFERELTDFYRYEVLEFSTDTEPLLRHELSLEDTYLAEVIDLVNSVPRGSEWIGMYAILI